jgi:hypothetical protein
MDTDATATASATDTDTSVQSSSSSSTDNEEASATPTSTEQSTSSTSSTTGEHQQQQQQQRTPRIHFLGKEGWAARLNPHKQPQQQAQEQPTVVKNLPPLHPMYGRPTFTEEEMEAFMLGGAEQAPKVIAHSSGAQFSY